MDEQKEKVIKYEEVISAIEDYEKIIRSRKKSILNVVFRQGQILKKLNNSKRFGEMIM